MAPLVRASCFFAENTTADTFKFLEGCEIEVALMA